MKYFDGSKNSLPKFSFFLILPFAFCLLPSSVGAHTFHTSLARIDYNAETKTAEISIQVFAHDLETALERARGKRVNLEKTPDIEKIIVKYLGERFVLKNKNGEVKKLTFVGKEQSADAVWLYVETAMPESLENASLDNRLFFELHNDQVNLVTARGDGKKQDFVFKPGDARAQEIFARANS
jgi:hypothetical protein